MDPAGARLESSKGANLKRSLKTIVVIVATVGLSLCVFFGVVAFGKIAKGPAENYGIMIVAAYLYLSAAISLVVSPFLLVSEKERRRFLGVGFASWALPWAVAFTLGLIQNQ